jgi:hypothetical protein
MTHTHTRRLGLALASLTAFVCVALSVALAPAAHAATNVGTVGCASYPAPCGFSFRELNVDGRAISSGSVREIVNVGQSANEVYDWTQTRMAANPTTGGIKGWVALRHVDQHNKYTLTLDGKSLVFVSDRAGHNATLAKVAYAWTPAHPTAHIRVVARGFAFQVYADDHLMWSGSDPQRAIVSGGNIILYTDSREQVCWETFSGTPI